MFIFACCSGDQLLQPSSVRTRDANARIRFTPKVNVPMLKSEDPRGAQANLKLLLPVSTLLVPLYGIHVSQLFHLTAPATSHIPLARSLPVSPRRLTKAGCQFSETVSKRGLLVSSQILTKAEYLLSEQVSPQGLPESVETKRDHQLPDSVSLYLYSLKPSAT